MTFLGLDDLKVQTCQSGPACNSWYGHGQVNARSPWVTHTRNATRARSVPRAPVVRLDVAGRVVRGEAADPVADLAMAPGCGERVRILHRPLGFNAVISSIKRDQSQLFQPSEDAAHRPG